MFIKNNLHYSIREVYINKKPVLVETIYRPNTPPKSDINIFMNTMQNLIDLLTKENKQSYI